MECGLTRHAAPFSDKGVFEDRDVCHLPTGGDEFKNFSGIMSVFMTGFYRERRQNGPLAFACRKARQTLLF